ncbi:MAG TPA: hypothetical protein VFM54_14875 [Micromonosporaceae bacterium]|nr:hypothetical protein [Micromonosporaceae bacterium]
MADHLTRLAARVLGQAPPVAPRLPSRFEPSWSELAQPEPAQAGSWWNRPGSGESLEDELADGEPVAGRRSRAGRDPAGVPTPADPQRLARTAGTAGHPPSARAIREPATTTPAYPGQPARPEQVTVVAAGQPPRATVHTGQPAAGQAQPARAGEPVRGAPVVPVTPAAPPPAPVPRPAHREPSVRISIGRIEVRAVPGPAATRAAAPAPAAPPRPAAARPPEPTGLSLTAYLSGDRGRAGGDRGRAR